MWRRPSPSRSCSTALENRIETGENLLVAGRWPGGDALTVAMRRQDMPVPLDQFVKQLEDTGILPAETLRDFVPPKGNPKDAEELAARGSAPPTNTRRAIAAGSTGNRWATPNGDPASQITKTITSITCCCFCPR